MTIDDVLINLSKWDIGISGEDHKPVYLYVKPEVIAKAKLALLEIIKEVKLKKDIQYEYQMEDKAFNQGVEAAMKAITDLFNREV